MGRHRWHLGGPMNNSAPVVTSVDDAQVLDALAQLAWHGLTSSITVMGTHDARVVAMIIRTGHVYDLNYEPDRVMLVEWAARVRARKPNEPMPSPPEHVDEWGAIDGDKR
jgi:hypothetical protein